MVKATELRLGNLVQDEGKMYIIDNISPEDQWEPITLTPEIALRAGFELKKKVLANPKTNSTYYDYYWYKDFVLKFNADYIAVGNVHINKRQPEFTVEGFLSNEVKYLHQLQNLYFVITGKELEIKL